MRAVLQGPKLADNDKVTNNRHYNDQKEQAGKEIYQPLCVNVSNPASLCRNLGKQRQCNEIFKLSRRVKRAKLPKLPETQRCSTAVNEFIFLTLTLPRGPNYLVSEAAKKNLCPTLKVLLKRLSGGGRLRGKDMLAALPGLRSTDRDPPLLEQPNF